MSGKSREMLPDSPDTHEFELKFLIAEPDFKAIQLSPLLGAMSGRARARRMESTYFDTETDDLSRQRIALRVRRVRGKAVQTLKWVTSSSPNGFQRGEIEVPTSSAEPRPSLFGEAVATKLDHIIQGRPLLPCVTTDIRRVVRQVQVGTSEIEVSFDVGAIVAGGQTLRVREMEAELKTGDRADLYHFGLLLAAAFPLRLGLVSKAERGAVLRTGWTSGAVRAVNPDFANRTVDEAIGTIITACIDQFVANWPVFEHGTPDAAIHQMRISMRRLRSALALFNRRFPCREFVAMRAEAKRLATSMGPARNWDVFAALLRDGPVEAFPGETGFEQVLAATAEQQRAGYATVAQVLADPATTRFVLSALEFVARRGWRNALTSTDLPRLGEPMPRFAAESLRRLHRRVRKRGRHLLEQAAAGRHDVRVVLKNLRYATDFFGHLFENQGQVRSYAHACSDLQDTLGAYNDTIMVTDLIGHLDLSNSAMMRASGVVLGWYGRGAVLHDVHLAETWKTFRKAKTFWDRALPDMNEPA
jgi:inorganic triphosphatase YgiF